MGDENVLVFVCLVGKGIIFDLGGYSLKFFNMMLVMKVDMGGLGMIIGVFGLVIMCGFNKCVKFILCCVENMVFGCVLKFGDIIIYKNGKIVEIMNIDVEGCLVLVDGFIYVSE